ncbi:MAG: sigma-70 family RNA polymerase sigma factor, partial [Acidimicrobiales bacterium]
MAERKQSFLQEWDLLQERVIPPLLGGHRNGSSSPRLWAMDNRADAIAVTVAFLHAGGTPSLRAWAPAASRREVTFRQEVIDALPGASVETWFRRRARAYVPDRAVADAVIAGEPDQPVDLVTLRVGALRTRTGARRAWSRAVGALRVGGRLLLDAAPASHPDEIAAVDPDGRLFEKSAPASAAGLVETHVALARSLARRFSHRGEATDDLEQVALLALVRAAGRFDPQRQVAFATYATASILGELKRHFRDRAWMLRVPRTTQELYLQVKEANDSLSQQLGASPTISQVATSLAVSDEAVLEALEAGSNFWPASL